MPAAIRSLSRCCFALMHTGDTVEGDGHRLEACRPAASRQMPPPAPDKMPVQPRTVQHHGHRGRRRVVKIFRKINEELIRKSEIDAFTDRTDQIPQRS
jgi:hypothetical protein